MSSDTLISKRIINKSNFSALYSYFTSSRNYKDFLKSVENNNLINDYYLWSLLYSNSEHETKKLMNELAKHYMSTEITLEKNSITVENYSSFKYKINGESTWRNLPNWAIFFIEVGKFIERNDDTTLYINYLDDIIPASFISFGILNSAYSQYKEEINLKNWLFENIKIGTTVSYLYDEKGNSQVWRQGEIIDIYNEESLNKEFNPFIKLKISLPGQSPLSQSVSYKHLFKKIRIGGSVKNTAGSTVFLKDDLKKDLREYFPKEISSKIKFFNTTIINFIGHNKYNPIQKFTRSFKLSERLDDTIKQYQLNSWFYSEKDSYNLTNINVISSDSVPHEYNDRVNLFVGANASLKYYQNQSSRNVFLVDRSIIHSDSVETLSDIIAKDNMLGVENITSDIINYFNKKNISIPKGVELYAYRKI